MDRSVPVTGVLHDDKDLLAGWASRPQKVTRSRRKIEPDPGSLRFAFYGRTSTSGFQDRVSSRQWQVESARDLIAGRRWDVRFQNFRSETCKILYVSLHLLIFTLVWARKSATHPVVEAQF